MVHEFAQVVANAIHSLMRPSSSISAPSTVPLSQHVFTTNKVPKMSIEKFIERTIDYMHSDNETFMTAVAYLLLLCADDYHLKGIDGSRRAHTEHLPKNLHLNEYNVHRLFFSAVLLAAKWRVDVPCTMEYYALVCGVPKPELVEMEWCFLELMDFNASVSNEMYHHAVSYVVSCTIRPSDVIGMYPRQPSSPNTTGAVDDFNEAKAMQKKLGQISIRLSSNPNTLPQQHLDGDDENLPAQRIEQACETVRDSACSCQQPHPLPSLLCNEWGPFTPIVFIRDLLKQCPPPPCDDIMCPRQQQQQQQSSAPTFAMRYSGGKNRVKVKKVTSHPTSAAGAGTASHSEAGTYRKKANGMLASQPLQLVMNVLSNLTSM